MLGVKVARKLLSPILDLGAIHIFSWTPGDNGSTPEEFEASEVPVDQIAAVARMLGRSAADFCCRVADGERCFISSMSGVAVHARWVTSRPRRLPETGHWVEPGEGEAYVYDSFTVPRWRGRRATRAARALMDRTLHSEGIRRAWNYVRSDNYASLRALSSFQKRVCTVRYLRLANGPVLVLGGWRCSVLRSPWNRD